MSTLGTRSEKGSTIVVTLGETQSIHDLESSAESQCKALTLDTTQSIQGLEDLEKDVGSIYTIGGDQSMTSVSDSGTEDAA